MYFGRDEDEQQNAHMEESILSANGFGNLETSARDAVRQIMDAAGIDDLSDVQNALRSGAMRVSAAGYLAFPFGVWTSKVLLSVADSL